LLANSPFSKESADEKFKLTDGNIFLESFLALKNYTNQKKQILKSFLIKLLAWEKGLVHSQIFLQSPHLTPCPFLPFPSIVSKEFLAASEMEIPQIPVKDSPLFSIFVLYSEKHYVEVYM
jgi:hypothetical protein